MRSSPDSWKFSSPRAIHVLESEIIPTLRMGAEEERSRGYESFERITPELMEGFDTSQLVCSHSRMVTSKGVYVCPILIETRSARMGSTLQESRGPYPLRHGACYTCYLGGAICSNVSSGDGPARSPLVPNESSRRGDGPARSPLVPNESSRRGDGPARSPLVPNESSRRGDGPARSPLVPNESSRRGDGPARSPLVPNESSRRGDGPARSPLVPNESSRRGDGPARSPLVPNESSRRGDGPARSPLVPNESSRRGVTDVS